MVLEPAAVADFIQDMSWISFGALLVQEGRSFLSGKMGQKVMGENITLRDDPYHPLHRGSPFDAEGMPTRPTTIIERGVARIDGAEGPRVAARRRRGGDAGAADGSRRALAPRARRPPVCA